MKAPLDRSGGGERGLIFAAIGATQMVSAAALMIEDPTVDSTTTALDGSNGSDEDIAFNQV